MEKPVLPQAQCLVQSGASDPVQEGGGQRGRMESGYLNSFKNLKLELVVVLEDRCDMVTRVGVREEVLV